MKQYYVYIPGNEAVQGPFPVAMIQHAYAQGIYNNAVMLKDVNGGDWVSIGSFFQDLCLPRLLYMSPFRVTITRGQKKVMPEFLLLLPLSVF